MMKKKKTIFWIRILNDTFSVGFWFGDKAQAMIEQSELPESVKNDFRNAKRFNVIRSISIPIFTSIDVENVIQLIDIKLKLK